MFPLHLLLKAGYMLRVRLAILLLCIPLLSAGCMMGRQGPPPLPPLVKAAQKGDIVTVRNLLAKGTDVHVRDNLGRTALMYAADNGDTAIVQALLIHGADANARDPMDWTALMFAAGSGNNATVQTLLDHKAHVNAKTSSGWTALMHATARGYSAIAQALLANGAEPNAKDRDEQTALLLAVRDGHTAIVEALLASGADPQVKNTEGKTALQIAETEGFSNIAQLLKQAIERGQAIDKPAEKPAFQGRTSGGGTRTQQPGIEPPAPVSPPTRSVGGPSEIDFGRYEALVIGNNAYTHLRPLRTAVNDAIAVADVLGNLYGFTVTLLADATRADIISALDNVRTRLTERDNLLIYYAGHGVLDTGEERGYWLPVNARADSRVHWIPNTSITDALKAMPARHVLVVADSCYAGTLVRGLDMVEPPPHGDRNTYIVRMAQKRSRTVLSSGGLEPVMDTGGGQHSVFAKAFLTVLQENADVLDGQQLFAMLRRPVVLNSFQTPEYSDIRYAGHEGGDFLFVRRSDYSTAGDGNRQEQVQQSDKERN
jgi:ankyrin repeat protein